MASHYNFEGPEGIISRRLVFCPRLSAFTTSELILTCDYCWCFAVYCCQHSGLSKSLSCHHYRLAFTDGACLNNGSINAKAGLDIAIGKSGRGIDQWAIPVTENMDVNQPRTSQRAELLAAIEGIKKLDAEDERPRCRLSREDTPEWVIATDSEYVVKGMTEWYPAWRARRWRTSSGRVPLNLDLFRALDTLISSVEDRGINVGFWHIQRQFNTLADSLAKEAARDAPDRRYYAVSAWTH
ncbi:hypothetical protein C0995_013973 [Termitomyces sp. Mi166|nr:hypothetical protein C0995_013973 [Termitomyces sp. Mi166\